MSMAKAGNPGRIRASVLRPLVELLDRKSCNTDTLLAQHGLRRAELADPYSAVPLDSFVEFFEMAAVRLKDLALGLRLGEKIHAADLGPIGVLFSVAPDLLTAFTRFSEYLGALQSKTQVGLSQTDGMPAWLYRIEDSSIWPRVQDAEFSLSAACRLVRTLSGENWRPIEVHFEHNEPRDRTLHDKIFRTVLRFRQPANRLFFSAEELKRPLRSFDPGLMDILQRHINELISKPLSEETLIDSVKRLIALKMGIEKVTVTSLCRELGVSQRTLQRRLEASGTSLRQLLREYRKDLAELTISGRRIPQSDVAQMLGYSDSTVFWRAFKSWNDQSPSAYRKAKSGG
jgi:AraC-like DNA-binding protein